MSSVQEYKVCSVKDLENENKECMKEVKLGENGSCLIIRQKDGNLSALSHKCTHYGAPLINGILSNGRIRCPWHGACFNSKTGDIEDFPGVDGLQKYEVTVKGDDVVVTANKNQLVNIKRNPLAKVKNDAAKNDYTGTDSGVHQVVIVGGGPSSLTCCETLRKEGFKGQIMVLCKDSQPTYDRPKLSKALDVTPESVLIRPRDYYRDIGVEFYCDVEVTAVDVLTKTVRVAKALTLANGEKVTSLIFNSLVLATGGEPRTLSCPGSNLQNIFVLRTVADANKIAEASKGKKVVIVGSSFIGMEVASFLTAKSVASSVSVVCGRRSEVPFQNSFGKDIGQVVMKMHEEKGVKFYPKTGVESFSALDGKNVVGHVTLTDGTKLDADVVVAGTGVTPATSFLNQSEIPLAKNGFIPVDGRMQTKVPHVYAVGDIAIFPLQMRGGELTNIQHWQMAHQHGVLAGRDIASSQKRISKGNYTGDKESSSVQAVRSVPFFWTVQFGVSIRYSGYSNGCDNVIIRGSLDEQKFAAYYVKNDIVVAVATMKMDPVAAKFAEDLFNGIKMRKNEIPK